MTVCVTRDRGCVDRIVFVNDVQKFFRRGLVESATYSCKLTGNCVINPRTRNACRYCRFQKCLESGMSRGGTTHYAGEPSHRTIQYFTLRWGAQYCDDYICLSVSLSAGITWKPHGRTSPIFVHVASGRGSVLLWRLCDIRYVFPVLWMTSCFPHNGCIRRVLWR